MGGLDHRTGDYRDGDCASDQGQDRGSEGRAIGCSPVVVSAADQDGQCGGGQSTGLEVSTPSQVKHQGPGQQDHRDHPRPVLSPPDSSSQSQQSNAGQGHEGARGAGGTQGEVFEDYVQSAPQRKGHCGEEVDHSVDGDGRSGDPAQSSLP
jgi:hypothetical protein